MFLAHVIEGLQCKIGKGWRGMTCNKGLKGWNLTQCVAWRWNHSANKVILDFYFHQPKETLIVRLCSKNDAFSDISNVKRMRFPFFLKQNRFPLALYSLKRETKQKKKFSADIRFDCFTTKEKACNYVILFIAEKSYNCNKTKGH